MFSDILPLYKKVKLFYTQKFYTDLPQDVLGHLIAMDNMIKSANNFYRR